MNPHQTLHQQLVQLRGQAQAWAAGHHVADFEPLDGICHNLSLSGAVYKELNNLIDRWPGNSGDKAFPVPHPQDSPKSAYELSSPAEFWIPKFEYARNRLALLDWLIEQTTPNN